MDESSGDPPAKDTPVKSSRLGAAVCLKGFAIKIAIWGRVKRV